ncbi:hypothetical protein AB1Y20_018968 [Prymnesium parvum]|uniref:Uncharacterized protein n=1 Tax=Prymnesium parvum TaxID=97485 RepID=A0AB34JTB3_PRYPA
MVWVHNLLVESTDANKLPMPMPQKGIGDGALLRHIDCAHRVRRVLVPHALVCVTLCASSVTRAPRATITGMGYGVWVWSSRRRKFGQPSGDRKVGQIAPPRAFVASARVLDAHSPPAHVERVEHGLCAANATRAGATRGQLRRVPVACMDIKVEVGRLFWLATSQLFLTRGWPTFSLAVGQLVATRAGAARGQRQRRAPAPYRLCASSVPHLGVADRLSGTHNPPPTPQTNTQQQPNTNPTKQTDKQTSTPAQHTRTKKHSNEPTHIPHTNKHGNKHTAPDQGWVGVSLESNSEHCGAMRNS